MREISGPSDHRSLWLKTTESTQYPRLSDPLELDVAIVGGGIVGILTAFELRHSGLRVALIEGGRVLEGVTGYTTGKLTSLHNCCYTHLNKALGSDGARRYYEANQWAIEEIRKHVEERETECDFVDTEASVVFTDQVYSTALNEELETLRCLGIPHRHVEGADPHYGGWSRVCFSDQAHFHPRKYLLSILDECFKNGLQVFENSRVSDVREEENACLLTVDEREHRADQVVIATNYPIHDSGSFVTKLFPYRSFAIAVSLKGDVPEGMYITYSEEPMHSTRPAFMDGAPVLIVGGGHHKVGQMDDVPNEYELIEAWARERFAVDQVVARWSTQDNWTADERPFIGKSPGRDRIFIATGFGGWGMTTGRVAASVLSSRMRGEWHGWQDLYDPSRFSFEMVPKLVKENLNSAGHLIGDRVSGVSSKSPTTLAPGSACVLDGLDERVAAYRDFDGTLHVVSAQCTHWGCQISWNSLESTWDCPCHGSRFSIEGDVLHGPATVPLEKKTGWQNMEGSPPHMEPEIRSP